jgi:hypothetical protein
MEETTGKFGKKRRPEFLQIGKALEETRQWKLSELLRFILNRLECALNSALIAVCSEKKQ